MTISIQLDPSVFTTGGLFEGTQPNRAVLMIGVGRDDVYIGKINTGTAANLSYRGGQTNLQIGTTGAEISDLMLEYMMTTSENLSVYGIQLIDMMERFLVRVYQDGIVLTPAQVKAFVA